MSSPESLSVLNRVLVTLRKSFLQYLRWARPYVPPGREAVLETLDEIVIVQDALAERISDYITAAGGSTESGDFSMEFTDVHDLEIDHIIQEAIGYQKQDIARLGECVDELRFAPTAQSLAAEALGMAKGQLESLEEIPIMPASSTIVRGAGPPARDND